MPQNTTQTNSTKNITINIRAKSIQRDLIDQAANSLGKSRSDFILETACNKAETVLLDQCYFALAGDKFEEFTRLLDQSPTKNKALNKLLTLIPPWE